MSITSGIALACLVLAAAPALQALNLPTVTNLLPMGEESAETEGGKTDSRIIGGRKASIREAPWTVSLVKTVSQGRVSICGGSILSERVVITAAHCCDNVNNRTLTIRSGSSYLFEGGFEHRPTKVMVHDKYDARTLDYDGCIIYCHPPFRYTDRVQAIEIAPERPKDGEMVTTYGWGETDDGNVSQQLRTVTVPVVNNETCAYDYRNFVAKVTDRMWCQGVVGKDHCKGDSGGPVVTVHRELAGIVSWGDYPCAIQYGPGVNVDVNHPEIRKHFIEKKVGI